MRSSVLLDTGPLVAYLYRRDAHHDWASEQFRGTEAPFISCEPVVTEACFLVARNGQRPTRVIELLARGIVRLGLTLRDEVGAVRALMERNADVPMSLADACLVRLAELTRLPICTLDADFAIYRAHGRQALDLISPRPRHLHEP
jgi:predicted nucleic acid-binding protein